MVEQIAVLERFVCKVAACIAKVNAADHKQRPKSRPIDSPPDYDGLRNRVAPAAAWKHCARQVDGGYRCLWCLRRAASIKLINQVPCEQAPDHIVWQADRVYLCSRCRAYSGVQTRNLCQRCPSVLGAKARKVVRDVLELSKHPKTGQPLPAARLWMVCERRALPLWRPGCSQGCA